MKRSLLPLIVLLVAMTTGHFSSGQLLNSSKESVTTNKLFETDDYSIYQFTDNTFTPVIRYKDAVYFVYADHDRKPMIGKIKDGTTETYPLDVHPDYYALDDRHHMFSISVDKKGYIHVVGDMHNFPHSNNKAHLPQEYQSAIILYWVSEQPEDVSAMEFVGNNEARAIPGFAFSYYSFQLDMNHELYMLSRIRVRKTQLKAGIQGLGLFKYDADNRSWEALGELPPIPNGDHPALYPCIAWEDDGFSDTGGWYQAFRASLRFDFNNRMHIATGVDNTSTSARNTHILYAYSDDGGKSFNQANGAQIATLPMRADPVIGQASIVEASEFYDLFASVTCEENGKPTVFYSRKGDQYAYGFDPTYRYWDKDQQNWSSAKDHPAGGLIKCKYLLDNKGIQNLIDGDPGGKIYRTYDISQTSYKAKQLYRRFHGMDEFGIHDSGTLTGFTGSVKENDGPMTITELVFNTASEPLPSEWTTSSIGTGINSSSGSINGIFEVEGAGLGIQSSGDEFTFVHQTMHGDGELIARVINVGYQDESSVAGLMVRASNTTDAPLSTASITYAKGVEMNSRSTTGGQITSIVLPKYRPAEWLKITREGDDFSSFRSDDGVNWKLIGTTTIVMETSVQAGFYVSSTVQGKTSTAHVDHLTLSASITLGQEPYSGVPTSLPGTIQVEEYDLGGPGVAYFDTDGINEGAEFRTDGVDIEKCSDTDGGYNLGWTEQGEWLEYTVDVTADDFYSFEFRVASAYSTGAFSLDLDENEIVPTQTIHGTNGWQSWSSVHVNDVALTKGVHVLRFNIVSGSFNMNKIIVTSTVTGQSELKSSPFELFPNPTNGNMTITTNSGFNGRYELFTLLGESVKSGPINEELQLDLSDHPSGLYILQFHNEQDSYYFEIEKQ